MCIQRHQGQGWRSQYWTQLTLTTPRDVFNHQQLGAGGCTLAGELQVCLHAPLMTLCWDVEGNSVLQQSRALVDERQLETSEATNVHARQLTVDTNRTAKHSTQQQISVMQAQ